MLMLATVWLSTAWAMDCGTPGQLDALRGGGSEADRARLEPPVFVGPHSGAPPPPADRTIYGTPSTWHVETEHFTVNWWDDTVTDAQVEAAVDALEVGWQAFVEEQGWPAPVSSDVHYVWVFLDPGLGGTTGYTTEYWDDNYPDGLPLIYINPTTLGDFGPNFYHALTVHEFMHAIQFGMRDYDWDTENGPLENWYWEASANHASELADPTVDGHQYTSAWYAEQPALRYDSYDGYHQYGMFVFNAWLEEALGAHSMRDTWVLSADRPGESWRDILSEATGVSAPVLWGDFSDAYGNGELEESDLYTTATQQGNLEDGVGGTLDELGTHYWAAQGDVVVSVDSAAVVLGGAGEPGESLRTGGDRIVSVTALSDDTSYVLTVSAPSDEPDDTGEPAAADTDSEEPAAASGGVAEDSKGTGCATVAWGGGLWWVLVALGARRR